MDQQQQWAANLARDKQKAKKTAGNALGQVFNNLGIAKDDMSAVDSVTDTLAQAVTNKERNILAQKLGANQIEETEDRARRILGASPVPEIDLEVEPEMPDQEETKESSESLEQPGISPDEVTQQSAPPEADDESQPRPQRAARQTEQAADNTAPNARQPKTPRQTGAPEPTPATPTTALQPQAGAPESKPTERQPQATRSAQGAGSKKAGPTSEPAAEAKTKPNQRADQGGEEKKPEGNSQAPAPAQTQNKETAPEQQRAPETPPKGKEEPSETGPENKETKQSEQAKEAEKSGDKTPGTAPTEVAPGATPPLADEAAESGQGKNNTPEAAQSQTSPEDTDKNRATELQKDQRANRLEQLKQDTFDPEKFIEQQKLDTDNQAKSSWKNKGSNLAGQQMGKFLSNRIRSGSFRWFGVALGLAVVKDMIDFGTIVISGGIIGTIVNIVISAAVYAIVYGQSGYIKQLIQKNIGEKAFRAILIEFVPLLNFIPMYTVLILLIWNESRHKLEDHKKSYRLLQFQLRRLNQVRRSQQERQAQVAAMQQAH